MKLIQSLFIVILALALSACSGFSPATRHANTRLSMADSTAATPSSSSSTNEQTYVKCGRCQTAYFINEADLGSPTGKGR